MKTTISKIASFTMALLVLFSTVSFTVEKHFCGDFLVDISYFGDTKGCSDTLDEDNCGESDKIKKDNCCKNEFEKIQGQDDLKHETSKKISLENQQFVLTFINSYIHLFTNFSKRIIPLQHYSPPNLKLNIQATYQVFII